MYTDLKFSSKTEVSELYKQIKAIGGTPTENRVLIISPINQEIKVGDIIIPDSVSKDNIPNKGVIAMIGEITEEYKSYENLLGIGKIITYGRYAGKEIEFNPEEVKFDSDKYKFTILSLNEILFIENNRNGEN